MGMQLRKGEDPRWWSRDRDLNNCAVPIMRAAVKLTEEAFMGDDKKIEEVGKLAIVLSNVVNEAKRTDSGAVMDVIRRMVQDIEGVAADVQFVLMRNFMCTLLARYVSGMRQWHTEEELSETDIFDIAVASGVAAFIPEAAYKKFAEKMRDRSKWKGLDRVGITHVPVKEQKDEPQESS